MKIVPAAFLLVWAISAAATAGEPARTVSGQMGLLGEWELSATVSAADGGAGGLSGLVILRHIGFCSADGPEEKTGTMRIVLSGTANEATGTLSIDGSTCTFKARLSDAHDGVVSCPDRRDVPLDLTIE